MSDKDKNYILDEETEDNDIVEYLERDLEGYERAVKAEENRRDRNKKGWSFKENPIIKFYQSNKMKVLWTILGILIIILLVALIIVNTGKEKDSQKATEPKTTEALQETTETPEEEVLLAEAADSEYNQLFEKYFQNSVVEWNEEALSQCYENMQNVSESSYSYLNKYVEAVQNIVCYVLYETEDGKEIVCVTYNMKFKNINTVAPAMDTFLLVKTDSGYKLHNFEVGEEIDMYTNRVQDNAQYSELISNINNQLGIALESDADLKKVYDALKNVGSEE